MKKHFLETIPLTVFIIGLTLTVHAGATPKDPSICDDPAKVEQCCRQDRNACFRAGGRFNKKDEDETAKKYYTHLCDAPSEKDALQAQSCTILGGFFQEKPAEGLPFLQKACSMKYTLGCLILDIFRAKIAVADGSFKEAHGYFEKIDRYCKNKEADVAQCKPIAIFLSEEKKNLTKAEKKSKSKDDLLCRCIGYEGFLQSQIDTENEAGKISGFVNATKLHRLGTMLLRVKKFKTDLEKKRASATLTFPDCDKKYRPDELAECDVAATESLAN